MPDAVINGFRQRGLKQRLADCRIGGHEREHGRHIGMNHPDALRRAADLDLAAVYLHCYSNLFVLAVGGYDRLGEIVAAIVG